MAVANGLRYALLHGDSIMASGSHTGARLIRPQSIMMLVTDFQKKPACGLLARLTGRYMSITNGEY